MQTNHESDDDDPPFNPTSSAYGMKPELSNRGKFMIMGDDDEFIIMQDDPSSHASVRYSSTGPSLFGSMRHHPVKERDTSPLPIMQDDDPPPRASGTFKTTQSQFMSAGQPSQSLFGQPRPAVAPTTPSPFEPYRNQGSQSLFGQGPAVAPTTTVFDEYKQSQTAPSLFGQSNMPPTTMQQSGSQWSNATVHSTTHSPFDQFNQLNQSGALLYGSPSPTTMNQWSKAAMNQLSPMFGSSGNNNPLPPLFGSPPPPPPSQEPQRQPYSSLFGSPPTQQPYLGPQGSIFGDGRPYEPPMERNRPTSTREPSGNFGIFGYQSNSPEPIKVDPPKVPTVKKNPSSQQLGATKNKPWPDTLREPDSPQSSQQKSERWKSPGTIPEELVTPIISRSSVYSNRSWQKSLRKNT